MTEIELEEYLAGTLAPDARRQVEGALAESDELRERLEAFKIERKLIEELKDSQAIRLPAVDEERIVQRGLEALKQKSDPPPDGS